MRLSCTGLCNRTREWKKRKHKKLSDVERPIKTQSIYLQNKVYCVGCIKSWKKNEILMINQRMKCPCCHAPVRTSPQNRKKYHIAMKKLGLELKRY